MRLSFQWLSESLTRKIGSLSTILLSFILVVIVYSIIKLLAINKEMREVAEIDIPLTEVIAEIEILQLQQHLLIRQLHIKLDKSASFEPLQKEFIRLNTALNEQLASASTIIKEGIAQTLITSKVAEHQQALSEIQVYKNAHDKFQDKVEHVFSSVAKSIDLRDEYWMDLEKHNAALDTQTITLLKRVESLTEEIAKNTEKHEREFLFVNAALGLSALFIGVHITAYIIHSFRQRMGHIHGQIETLQRSIVNQSPIDTTETPLSTSNDELSELANDIHQLMQKYDEQRSNRYEFENQLIKLATTDKLTGAFNRHNWEDALVQEIEHAKQDLPVSLILFDVDHFKKINDTHGHDVGDKVLKYLTFLIQQNIRKTDPLFRLGGEEFAILVRDLDLNQAKQVAEKLRRLIEKIDSQTLPSFTVSFGVSQFIQEDTPDSIFKRVDRALYSSKTQGRNQVSSA
ncbi:GGDEF domain-containing protein [Agaribacter flavus]|uniref:diguanylate cyclase n=1 Tax=Agaribacter flavus TaxID=1902781 RepID=A0ABV7FQA4_9ALTE